MQHPQREGSEVKGRLFFALVDLFYPVSHKDGGGGVGATNGWDQTCSRLPQRRVSPGGGSGNPPFSLVIQFNHKDFGTLCLRCWALWCAVRVGRKGESARKEIFGEKTSVFSERRGGGGTKKSLKTHLLNVFFQKKKKDQNFLHTVRDVNV